MKLLLTLLIALIVQPVFALEPEVVDRLEAKYGNPMDPCGIVNQFSGPNYQAVLRPGEKNEFGNSGRPMAATFTWVADPDDSQYCITPVDSLPKILENTMRFVYWQRDADHVIAHGYRDAYIMQLPYGYILDTLEFSKYFENIGVHTFKNSVKSKQVFIPGQGYQLVGGGNQPYFELYRIRKDHVRDFLLSLLGDKYFSGVSQHPVGQSLIQTCVEDLKPLGLYGEPRFTYLYKNHPVSDANSWQYNMQSPSEQSFALSKLACSFGRINNPIHIVCANKFGVESVYGEHSIPAPFLEDFKQCVSSH